MFIEAKQQHVEWNLTNRWGHSMQIPALAADACGTVQIGTLGTRFVAPPGVPKTKLMARMLKGLQRPLILIDTRRTGVGGMGANRHEARVASTRVRDLARQARRDIRPA